MQQKVSVVIPCYNKSKWMSNMFDSIIAQKWDNVELILVNDGSTDSTPDIINEYKPKFNNRGFEVAVIEQENQGVAMAVRNGLTRVSGAFVCQIDADDELEPEYLSTMAGFLNKNREYDWVACDALVVRENSSAYISTFPNGELLDCNLGKWISNTINRGCWAYMVRYKYLIRCNVIKLYYTGRESYQETQFFIPLVLGEGKIKYFREPLYRYNRNEYENNLSYGGTYEKAKIKNDGLIYVFNRVIYSMDIDEGEKRRYNAISELQHSILLLIDTLAYRFEQKYVNEAFDIILKYVYKYFKYYDNNMDELAYKHTLLFCSAIEDNVYKKQTKDILMPSGRIIVWGAKGRNATVLLPFLEGTNLDPDELWDVAGGDNVIKKPDLNNLNENDLVLILPGWNGDIVKSLETIRHQNFILYDDVVSYLAKLIFPGFYNGSVIFEP